jgi:hypothetical protein
MSASGQVYDSCLSTVVINSLPRVSATSCYHFGADLAVQCRPANG